MVQQLFRPFRWDQWVRLSITGLLAGELSGAGGCSFQIPGGARSRDGADQFLAQAVIARNVVLISLAIFVGIALVIALVYVSSRMRFVLFDSIVAKECRIRRYWAAHGEAAYRYFGFQLLFILTVAVTLVSIAGIAMAIGFGLGWLRNPGRHVVALIIGGFISLSTLATFMITAAVVMVLTRDFVVPQMALENVGVVEGWSRLWARLATEKGGYAGYIGLKILLSIGAAVALGIAALIVVFVWLIPMGAVAAIAIFGGRAIGLGWNVATISIAIVAGAIGIAIILASVLLISAPVVVFFPAYSIYFFAARYAALNAAIYPPPATDG